MGIISFKTGPLEDSFFLRLFWQSLGGFASGHWKKKRETNKMPLQGRRKVSIIGEAPIKSVPKFPKNIGGAQLLAAPNIGGARAPVPPLFLRP